MGEIKNFAKFYALLKNIPDANADMKEQLVSQYTNGRTESLREMSKREYYKMCADMEAVTGINAERKKERSIVLHLMQNLGINTADWPTVDNFTMHPRIAGKPFRRLSPDELRQLERKLRKIERKGGLKAKGPMIKTKVLYVPLTDSKNEHIN